MIKKNMKKIKKIKNKIKNKENKKAKKENYYDAIVLSLLPNTKFKLMLLSNQKIVIGYLAGKLYKNNIRILKGDKVQIDHKIRIMYRYKVDQT
ncbi:hypothetical protein DH96_01540 [Candidatus Phytoplasma oryzae]|uniref:S1-like domain-containing protein n=1 Tax=Candidatus Phytoplasma oryzae TaxID=203274 RepID=A0A328IKH8_9MOLU|nr:translation initiation factor IF-1 [Candidatus Phytoplasma oryzae]RAM57764.1 hypothetical protein DH96_01540 [Candidatus Phytoplasma oryzae]